MPDVTLENLIKEAQIPMVLDRFTKITGARIDMNAHKSTETAEFNGNWNFTIEEQGDTETSKAFGERVLRELGIAVLRLVDYAEDQDRYRTEVSALTPASQDVPGDIIE